MSPSAPRVSVVIPTHNRSALLRVAVHSALAQTLAGIEVIIVDDGSTDATADVVRAIRDPRVKYLRNDPARGAAGARNAGVRAAAGEWLAFLDDDDQWFPDKLEKQLRALESAPRASLCLSSYVCHSGPEQVEYIGGERWFSLIDFRRGVDPLYRLIVTSGWMVRRSHLLEAGLFDESIPVWEDWELAIRLSRRGPFIHVDEPLFLFNRDRPAGQTENRPARAVAMQRLIDKHGALWTDGAVRSRHCLIIASSAGPHMGTPERRRWLQAALRHDWTNLIAWKLWLKTWHRQS